MAGQNRITINDIARRAGVSKQTVSRVLNARPDVAEETRQRVQQVIDRLGYQPSRLARSLSLQKSHTLGIVTAGLRHMGPSRTLNGIADQAEAGGYTILLKELPGFDSREVQPVLDILLAQHVEGIVWAVPEVGDNREWVDSLQIPVPVLFLTMSYRARLAIVTMDNAAGARLATRHLIARGRRHIAHIAGPLNFWEARQRKSGWQETLVEAGTGPEEHRWIEADWSSASAGPAMCHLLERYPQMDAVFAANDQIALGVLHCLHQKGIRVPDDLAVVGFDGLPESACFWPPLTTVYQDQRKVGCTAVSELASLIEARKQDGEESRYVLFEPELVVRASSGGV